MNLTLDYVGFMALLLWNTRQTNLLKLVRVQGKMFHTQPIIKYFVQRLNLMCSSVNSIETSVSVRRDHEAPWSWKRNSIGKS